VRVLSHSDWRSVQLVDEIETQSSIYFCSYMIRFRAFPCVRRRSLRAFLEGKGRRSIQAFLEGKKENTCIEGVSSDIP